MDWVVQKEKFLESLKKYRFVLLAMLIGICLMALPEEKQEPSDTNIQDVQNPTDLADDLGRLLSKVTGAGTVEVLLTQKEGERTVYQNDESKNGEDIRKNTVLVTDSNRTETGLVRQVNPPIYRGAVVLCQGADQAQVRLAIVEAVMRATGLSSDMITVLKMK